MIAICGISQLFATSSAAKLSGKKTERIPWVSHLSGKSAANCCIHCGSVEKTKKTPLKNCRIITIGETTAEAPRPFFGTAENAIPKIVEQILPRSINQPNLIHRSVVFGKSKPSIDSQVLDFRESLQTIEWKKILKPTGLKQLKEYTERGPGAGEIFSKLKLKCPINTKAAIFYNDFLRFKKLDKINSLFQVGDKMFLAYLKNNPYKIDVIGFNGYDDPPEIIEFINTYIDRDGIFDGVMKNKLETLYKDIGWGQPIFNRNVHKFFKFG